MRVIHKYLKALDADLAYDASMLACALQRNKMAVLLATLGLQSKISLHCRPLTHSSSSHLKNWQPVNTCALRPTQGQ
jgi:hypothetical protein